MNADADPMASDGRKAGEPVKMPERYRKALYRVVDDLMPDDLVKSMGQWLFHNRGRMAREGDDTGELHFCWHVPGADADCDLLPEFKARIVDEIRAALEPCGVDDFDLGLVETAAVLYHHGGHLHWHHDAPGGHDGTPAPRRLSFVFFMHTEPKMFSGGELEFLDGTLIEPRNNRICFFASPQMHRVRRVECWSAHVLHGRWSLSGWLHEATGG